MRRFRTYRGGRLLNVYGGLPKSTTVPERATRAALSTADAAGSAANTAVAIAAAPRAIHLFPVGPSLSGGRAHPVSAGSRAAQCRAGSSGIHFPITRRESHHHG